ncbi:peptidase S8/S53 domain-containing protein [Aspergillus pseudodeflectus]|uniref:Peptidase S8/S53 domain-containing protein n=1 Tax=Aspergillus pseudodeflectus TaxID=176178 RepID=A0ABR4JCH9_9EURO
MLKSMEEYFQANFPSLEWEDLEQLELAMENIIRPRRGRPSLLEMDEASSRDESSSLMDSIHSSIPPPQTTENAATRREITDPAAHQLRRPRTQSTRSGQRRSHLTTEASAVPSLIKKRSTNFTFGTNIVEESALGKEVSYKTFQYLNATVDRRLQHKERDERVRIAVLDTGIDLSHEDFTQARTKDFVGRTGRNPVRGELAQIKRLKAYRNFCIQDGDTQEEETNVNDHNGHGTQVAGIILRLAPNTDLYITRVCAGKSHADPSAGDEDPFQEPQPFIVAKAVEWAIERKVHIINLSLGYRHSDPATMESLRASLDRARAHKILVFAAASNEGLHESVAWPASDLQYAIGVHSATDAGKESDTTAPPLRGSYNFMVVGERILSQWPTGNGGGFRLCTGSSFAAPVMTAIAALILAFTWQTRCKKEREKVIKKIRLDDIQTNSGMARVLSRISKIKGDFYSVSPQLFWEDYHDLEDLMQNEIESRQHAWQIIEAALRL